MRTQMVSAKVEHVLSKLFITTGESECDLCLLILACVRSLIKIYQRIQTICLKAHFKP
jgi:hypothetical protein